MTNFGIETLKQGVAAFGLELSPGQLTQFQHYAELICEWNSKTNLTSIEPEDFGSRHFLDSLSIFALPEFDKVKTLVDIGSGAGLPGLAIKIARPAIDVVLIESLSKRVAFLKRAVLDLGLRGVQVEHIRVENLCKTKPDLNGHFDCAVARAVASLGQLHQWMAPLIKERGVLVAYKAELDKDELIEVKNETEFRYRTVSLNVEGRGAKRTLVIGTKISFPEVE